MPPDLTRLLIALVRRIATHSVWQPRRVSVGVTLRYVTVRYVTLRYVALRQDVTTSKKKKLASDLAMITLFFFLFLTTPPSLSLSLVILPPCSANVGHMHKRRCVTFRRRECSIDLLGRPVCTLVCPPDIAYAHMRGYVCTLFVYGR